MFDIPPLKVTLGIDQIHVWTAPLDQSELLFQSLYQTLSQDEHVRAEQLVFKIDRKRFVVCRGILRAILARYLNANAEDLFFAYGAKGKPALGDSCGDTSLYFNLSHSEGVALFAFAQDHEVGVDIEFIRDISDMEHIAERSFSIKEMAIFRSLPDGKKKEGFFNCWTRKEAFAKALGDGLSLPLDTFDVSFIPGKPAQILGIQGNEGETPQWSIQELCPAPNYVGAFAVKNRMFETKLWQWKP